MAISQDSIFTSLLPPQHRKHGSPCNSHGDLQVYPDLSFATKRALDPFEKKSHQRVFFKLSIHLQKTLAARLLPSSTSSPILYQDPQGTALLSVILCAWMC
ncbi:hypothetical protein AAC387_Pa01g1243 [Persea americana]